MVFCSHGVTITLSDTELGECMAWGYIGLYKGGIGDAANGCLVVQ